jgi:hypothetical protein
MTNDDLAQSKVIIREGCKIQPGLLVSFLEPAKNSHFLLVPPVAVFCGEHLLKMSFGNRSAVSQKSYVRLYSPRAIRNRLDQSIRDIKTETETSMAIGIVAPLHRVLPGAAETEHSYPTR